MPTLEDIIADYVMDIQSPNLIGGYKFWLEASSKEYGAWAVYDYVSKHPEMQIREAIIKYIYICDQIMKLHPYMRIQFRAARGAALDILDIVDAMY